MNKSIPTGAAYLLAFIYKTETSKIAPGCYDVIYGNRQSQLTKPLTQMTLTEVQTAQRTWSTKRWASRFKSRKASSAAGAAQFMRATLGGLIQELNLSGRQKLDGDLQDCLAYHLLKRRGYEAFMNGKISRTEFGKRLAQEWASFPVLTACNGAHNKLKRGQSYYAGDSLNKALVSAVTVEAVLDQVKELGNVSVAPTSFQTPKTPNTIPTPAQTPNQPAPKLPLSWFSVAVVVIGTSLVTAWSWIADLPCNSIGIFCGG